MAGCQDGRDVRSMAEPGHNTFTAPVVELLLRAKGDVEREAREKRQEYAAAEKRLLQKEDVPVIIQADKSSQSGLLVQIVGEAKLAGATKVSVATAAGSGRG